MILHSYSFEPVVETTAWPH